MYVRDLLDKTRYKLAYYYHLQNYQKIAKNIIRNATPSIKKLNKSQIEEIKDYYKKFGFTIKQVRYHRILTSINDEFSVKYIPEDIFHLNILPALNCSRQAIGWGNKAMFDYFFPDEPFPETVIRNMNGLFYDAKYEIITRDKALCIAKDLEGFVIKPSLDTGSGIGVKYIDNTSNINELFDNYRCDYLIQLPINQHRFYKSLNPSSVNSLKIMSLLWEGETIILSVMIRIGARDSFTDNLSSKGAYVLSVNREGCIQGKKFSDMGSIYDIPQSLSGFYNKPIPGYFAVVDIINRLHIKMPYFKLISWDFAIDERENPVIIEYNLSSPNARNHQIFNGPLFGDLTDEVLEYVYKKQTMQ
jgi:hypothetical protein